MIGEKPQYPGRCMLCGEVVNKGQMTRHLKTCVLKHAGDGGQTVKLFHLVVEGNHSPMYWLHVEIPGAMTLAQLDAFLRDIWLECCGHLSCFTIDGQRYAAQPMDEPMFGPQEESMRQKIYSVLNAGTTFQHEYDYGSTTELKLRVIGVREAKIKKPEVTLLARNVPPAWNCVTCGNPATQIQASGWGLDSDALFCDDCVGEDEDEGFLPVVNSPRAGVCGYCG